MKKIRVGIVGTGQRVCLHGGCVFRESRDKIHIVALCDINAERLENARKMYENEFGYGIHTYQDYMEMFKNATLDAVYIATPNYLHAEMTIKALEIGLHVLCEKPMELSLAKCDKMIAVAEKSGKVLSFAMQMHYRHRYHKVKELIDKGEIGKVAMAWCTEYRDPFAAMKDWVWDPAKSGGAIVEKNCHHYDILDMWISSRPISVYATGNVMKHHKPHGIESGIIDNAWIITDYESGARSMVGISFLANKHHYREFGVIGTEGKIFFSSNDKEIVHVVKTNGDSESYAINLSDNITNDIEGSVFNEFLSCIVEGGEPMVDGAMAKNSMLIPLAAELSIREKRIVLVNELK
jgi:predicted dehydrogenase